MNKFVVRSGIILNRRAMFVLMCLIVVIITGCAKEQSAPAEGEKPIVVPQPAPPSKTIIEKPPEPIELSMWYTSSVPPSEEAFMDLYGNLIIKKFPHITPKFLPSNADNTFDKLMSSNHPIDLVSTSIGLTAGSVLANDLQYDISDLIKYFNYDLDQLEPSTVEIQRQIANGGIYGLPVSTDTMTLFYNRELFERFGVSHPQDGMMWEDVYDLTKQMARTDGTTRYYGIGGSPTHAFQMDPLSAPFVDPETNQSLLTSEVFKRSFQVFTDLFTIAGNQVDSSTWSYSSHLRLFQKEKVMAMLIGTSALGYAYFADKDELDWDVVSYPTYSDLPEIGPQTYPVYYYVSSISKHKEQAFEVTAYMTSKEFQTHLAERGALPILDDLSIMGQYGKSLPYMADKNIRALLPNQFASPAYKGKYQSVALTQITEAIRRLLLQETDINTALREADEKVNNLIAELKAKE